MAGLLFWKKKTVNRAGLPFWKNENCFELRFEGVQTGIHLERKGELGHSIQTDRRRKGARTNSGQSGKTNLEAESIRSRAESTGGCVKLKTVTEIRRNSVCDTFIAECLSCAEFLVGLAASGKIETGE